MWLSSIRSHIIVAVLVIGAGVPCITHAQQGPAGDRGNISRDSSAAELTARVSGSTNSRAPAGPRIVPSGIVAPAKSALPGFSAPEEASINAGSNVAMMGVGAAGIIIGSMIGGDSGTMIAVGGAVVGLIGLFRFLR